MRQSKFHNKCLQNANTGPNHIYRGQITSSSVPTMNYYSQFYFRFRWLLEWMPANMYVYVRVCMYVCSYGIAAMQALKKAKCKNKLGEWKSHTGPARYTFCMARPNMTKICEVQRTLQTLSQNAIFWAVRSTSPAVGRFHFLLKYS